MLQQKLNQQNVETAMSDVPMRRLTVLTVRSFVSGSVKGPVEEEMEDDPDVKDEVTVMTQKVRKKNEVLEVRGWVRVCRQSGTAPVTSRTGQSRQGFGWRPLGPKDTPKAQ